MHHLRYISTEQLPVQGDTPKIAWRPAHVESQEQHSAIVRIGRLLLFPSCLLTTLFVASIRFAPATTHAQTRQQDFGLPELHRIVSITLQPAYGCRSPQDLQKGYEKTALFVSVLPFSVKWQLSDCIEFIDGNKN
jgi:hypothetical protein